MVNTQFSTNVKSICSDNKYEFCSTECNTYFDSLDIIHQSSYTYTPQQNKVAEHKHCHLLEVDRSLKFQSHVPSKFWGECVLTSCFFINCLPTSLLQWKSLFELLYNKSPNLSILRIFEWLCYATKPHYTDKFLPKAILSVFMGYSGVQKR